MGKCEKLYERAAFYTFACKIVLPGLCVWSREVMVRVVFKECVSLLRKSKKILVDNFFFVRNSRLLLINRWRSYQWLADIG